MTQDAVVTKLIDKRTAEVEVERGTACGGNCGHCSAADCGSRKKEYESETNTSGQE